jgi:hypothetical protein
MKLTPLQIVLIFFVLLIVLISLFIYYHFFISKELELTWPRGGEVLRAGHTYNITWKARKIDKIDIVLIKDEEPKKTKVIVQGFPAKEKKYSWEIFPFEEPSERYKISIFESEFKKEGKKDESGHFTILGPKFLSCEQLTISKNWPFIPNDYPNLKRVFITRGSYNGNLGGLDGADRICQEEAKRKGLGGNWKAFLGDDNISATERLKLDGIFVFAEAEEGLPQEKIPAYFWESFKKYLDASSRLNPKLNQELSTAYQTLTKYFIKFYERWNLLQENKSCYRFLASDFQQFYKKLFSPYLVMRDSPEEEFFKKFFDQEIWVGRIYPEDRKSCIKISPFKEKEPSITTSFTLTCQNWTSDKRKIEAQAGEFLPQCYIGPGRKVNALAIGGAVRTAIEENGKRTIEIVGRDCSSWLRLLCIEQ